jgi:aspartate kinase
MALVVQKYGGTSVANIERIKNVAGRAAETYDKGHQVVVILSAMAGVTDRLIHMAEEASGSPDKREMDVLLATGEQTTAALLAMILKDMGYRSQSLLGHQAEVVTDCDYGNARIIEIGAGRLRALLERKNIVVVAGFQGYDLKGNITTLGRGGSDTSAVAIAAAIEADVCEIYTDVDGIYTADPNVCEKARKLKTITYDEMLNMASLGAKVLQIRSVGFAKKYNIPVHVRSSFNKEEGTMVVSEDSAMEQLLASGITHDSKNKEEGTMVVSEDSAMEQLLVSGVTHDSNQARVTITKVPDQPGIAAKIFSPISEAGILVDMIIQNTRKGGKTDLTFTVPKADFKKTMELSQKTAEAIRAQEVLGDGSIAKVSVIGVGMKNHSGVASVMFNTLARENINIIMISTSEIRISCVVEEKYAELAVRVLHTAFGLDEA